MLNEPTIHILMATFNGGRFIGEQLASIARQSHARWTLTVSDDDSTDETISIVQGFANQVPQAVTLLKGPRKGSTHNFFNLIRHVTPVDPQDLFAFCDQDDVWLDDKLERAVKWHSQHLRIDARLYCGRTQFVDAQLQPIGLSPGLCRPPSFGNALVQNIASGNTMVMSQAVLWAQKKVQPHHSVWHDWTTYLVTTAIGGLVAFDEDPCLQYRQHSNNVIGANDGLSAQIKRLKPLFQGRYKQWTDANLAAVQDLGDRSTPTACDLTQDFESIRKMVFPWSRLRGWRSTVIRRQTFRSNLSLGIGLFFALT